MLGPGFLRHHREIVFTPNPGLSLSILSLHLAHLLCSLGASPCAFARSPRAGHGPWRAWGPLPPQAAPGPSSGQGLSCIPAGGLIL